MIIFLIIAFFLLLVFFGPLLSLVVSVHIWLWFGIKVVVWVVLLVIILIFLFFLQRVLIFFIVAELASMVQRTGTARWGLGLRGKFIIEVISIIFTRMLRYIVIIIVKIIIRCFKLLNLLRILYVFDPRLKIPNDMLIMQSAQHSHLPFNPFILLLIFPVQPYFFNRIYILIDLMPR